MPRVLIAGAAGFIGSHLADRLLAEGNTVVGVDNFITGAPENLVHLHANPLFSFIEADLTRVVPPLEPVDAIYHLASPASPIDYLKRPFETLYAGSDATRLLLERAERDGARFLLASTSEVYGDPLVHPQPESYWGNVNPVGPRGVYDEAKRYAEALTMAFHRYRGVSTRIARIFNTYGPRMRLDDGRVIPMFCGQALRREPITVYGDGSQTRSYCYVTDLVDGLVRLMASDLIDPCNLGNPYELSVSELAKVVATAAGSDSAVIFEPLPEDDPRQRRPDITRAIDRLGWAPIVSFDSGLATTIAHFQARI